MTPLKNALHEWENAAAWITGVHLMHGIPAQLEPKLAAQLVAPKSQRPRKR